MQQSLQRKKSLLSRIAIGTFKENIFFIPQRVLLNQILAFIKNLPDFSNISSDIDASAILKSIESQHGIFVEQSKGVFAFSHLTFQEFFAAQYIVESKNEKTIDELIENYLYDDRWREVIILVAGMLYNADELLVLANNKNNKLLINFELNGLLSYTRQSLLGITSNYELNLRQVCAILLLLSKARSRSIVIQRDMSASITIDKMFVLTIYRVLILAKLLDSDNKLSMILEKINPKKLENQVNVAAEKKLKQAIKPGNEIGLKLSINSDDLPRKPLNNLIKNEKYITSKLNIDSGLLNYFALNSNWTVDGIETIKRFFEAQILIFQCIQSDIYISNEIRQHILETALSPREFG